MNITLEPGIAGLEEVSKSDGRLIRHTTADGWVKIAFAQGDGRLFRLVRGQ